MSSSNSVTEVRNFFRVEGYYRHFLLEFAKISSPLIQLTRKDVPFVWTEDFETSFQDLKDKRVTVSGTQCPTTQETI